MSANPRGVTTQENIIDIFTAMRDSNLKKRIFLIKRMKVHCCCLFFGQFPSLVLLSNVSAFQGMAVPRSQMKPTMLDPLD
jgi:hypothetical protein